jgi:hypothetical protein
MNPRSPLLWALLAGTVVLLAAMAPVGWQMVAGTPGPAPAGRPPPPWQIEAEPGAVRGFGLRLPGATLADAQRLWGDDLHVAVIGSRHRPAALEAYVERWQGGGVEGRLVLATDAAPAELARWQQQAARRERIDADAERWTLSPDDRAEALRRAITGLSFLPAGRLDAATLEARFGAPGQRLRVGSQQHALYPERGLAIARDESSGKVLVQLVAPGDFEARLRVPLAAALSASAAVPASGPTR